MRGLTDTLIYNATYPQMRGHKPHTISLTLIMAPRNANGPAKKAMNRGVWTQEEDQKLAQCIEAHGAKKWKTVAVKSGLNRCGKSCRLRWLNYLRPNIKRGNISDEEEDLILRLHKLLGNRWSLIAGRLPGRTDNEIKNYWNSHLCKKLNQEAEKPETSTAQETIVQNQFAEDSVLLQNKDVVNGSGSSDDSFDLDEFFNFSSEETFEFDWINKYLELDQVSESTQRI